jgi:hypothetical protein
MQIFKLQLADYQILFARASMGCGKHGERYMKHEGTESTESTKKHGEKYNQTIIEKNSVYLCVIRACVVKNYLYIA